MPHKPLNNPYVTIITPAPQTSLCGCVDLGFAAVSVQNCKLNFRHYKLLIQWLLTL